MSQTPHLKKILDEKHLQYDKADFIPNDPICIPKKFTQLQDIEIMGFFASILAWGQRVTIINKCEELIKRFDGKPYDFILHHSENDLKNLSGFVHRTFNDTDLLYFVHFLHLHYQKHPTLETAFTIGQKENPDWGIETALINFRQYFTHSPNLPNRTKKHISSPSQKSSCKRLNMFLRWMVRPNRTGVDFGVWKCIQTSQLICPCDLHVIRVAKQLGLITREKSDWKTALELTEKLRLLDPNDPVKYDFALFGMGLEQRYGN